MLGIILVKKSSDVSDAALRTGGAGAAVGAILSLLAEKPSLARTLRDTLFGGGVGALIGGGAEALSADKKPAATMPTPQTVAEPAPDGRKGMSLPLAALSGLAPGLGPAAHGASAGLGQAVGSGLASLGAASMVTSPLMDAVASGVPGAKARAWRRGTLASVLAALAAAGVGNAVRSSAANSG